MFIILRQLIGDLERKIDKLPLISMHKIRIMSKFFNIKTLALLNYIDYNKKDAIAELEKACGFEYYKAKTSGKCIDKSNTT